jgi:hypothetical protein
MTCRLFDAHHNLGSIRKPGRDKAAVAAIIIHDPDAIGISEDIFGLRKTREWKINWGYVSELILKL